MIVKRSALNILLTQFYVVWINFETKILQSSNSHENIHCDKNFNSLLETILSPKRLPKFLFHHERNNYSFFGIW